MCIPLRLYYTVVLYAIINSYSCLKFSFTTQLKTLHPINCPSVGKLCYSSLDSTVVRLLNSLGRNMSRGREEKKHTTHT